MTQPLNFILNAHGSGFEGTPYFIEQNPDDYTVNEELYQYPIGNCKEYFSPPQNIILVFYTNFYQNLSSNNGKLCVSNKVPGKICNSKTRPKQHSIASNPNYIGIKYFKGLEPQLILNSENIIPNHSLWSDDDDEYFYSGLTRCGYSQKNPLINIDALPYRWEEQDGREYDYNCVTMGQQEQTCHFFKLMLSELVELVNINFPTNNIFIHCLICNNNVEGVNNSFTANITYGIKGMNLSNGGGSKKKTRKNKKLNKKKKGKSKKRN